MCFMTKLIWEHHNQGGRHQTQFLHTCTCDSVTLESGITGAGERAISVSTGRVRVTVMCVCGAFINICK